MQILEEILFNKLHHDVVSYLMSLMYNSESFVQVDLTKHMANRVLAVDLAV